MAQIPGHIWSKLSEGAQCLPHACAAVREEFYMNQLVLAGNLFIDTLNRAKDEVNPRVIQEIEFSFNDLKVLSEELMPEEQQEFERCFEMVSDGISRLKAFAPFPDVKRPVLELRNKLRERITANERSKFLPPESRTSEPLPHAPASLSEDAESLRQQLRRAGFDTPMLDALAQKPDEIEIRDCEAIVEELDTILA
jgi:hypothetical protein